MTLANDIISCRVPDFDYYLQTGETLDDIDEYGFTPLIETVITRQINVAEMLIERGVDINKPDVSGRTALHWAVDNNDLPMVQLLLANQANPNTYTSAGLSVLVYPLLRSQNEIKHLLYQYGAKLDFAFDFIAAKLLGHRYELEGDVDIVNAEGQFIELDYEGFILEFTVAIIKDSLQRFTNSYSTRRLRRYFPFVHPVITGFAVADELLKLQHCMTWSTSEYARLEQLIRAPMLILPAASRGHAIGFIRYQQWWAKIDRGENSLKEGCVNIYRMLHPEALTVSFFKEFLYKKQSRRYFHQEINQQLGLVPFMKIPISPQIAGNCSWANIQALVVVAYTMQQLAIREDISSDQAINFYEKWVEWDKDRALDECIHRFHLANPVRKASFASMLAAVLFQSCDASDSTHLKRAEKILAILTIPDYYYILQSYLDIFCVNNLTLKGNNLLKLLDDCGVNPGIGVTPIATGLKARTDDR